MPTSLDNNTLNLDSIKEQVLKALQNKKVQTALLAGAGTGLAGGVLSAQTPKRRNETKGQRRMRILRDMLASGVTGAGVVGGAMYGMDQLNKVLPTETPDPVKPSINLLGKGTLAAGAGLGTRSIMNNYKANQARDLLNSLKLKDAGTGGSIAFRKGIIDSPKGVLRALYEEMGNKGTMFNMVDEGLRTNGVLTPITPAYSKKPINNVGEFFEALEDIGLKRRLTGEGSTLSRIRDTMTNKGLSRGAKAKAFGRGAVRMLKRHPGLATGAATLALADPVLKGIGNAVDLLPNVMTYE